MLDLKQISSGFTTEQFIENIKKYRSLVLLGFITFFAGIGFIFGFDRLLLGFAVLVCAAFWIGLIFAIKHDFEIDWKTMAIIVFVWLILILSVAGDRGYSDDECLQSYDLKGSYCE